MNSELHQKGQDHKFGNGSSEDVSPKSLVIPNHRVSTFKLQLQPNEINETHSLGVSSESSDVWGMGNI